jgi:hypothetical protein
MAGSVRHDRCRFALPLEPVHLDRAVGAVAIAVVVGPYLDEARPGALRRPVVVRKQSGIAAGRLGAKGPDWSTASSRREDTSTRPRRSGKAAEQDEKALEEVHGGSPMSVRRPDAECAGFSRRV